MRIAARRRVTTFGFTLISRAIQDCETEPYHNAGLSRELELDSQSNLPANRRGGQAERQVGYFPAGWSGFIAPSNDGYKRIRCTAGFGHYVELYITAIMLSPQLCRVSMAWVDLGRATPRNAEALATRHWT